MTRGHRACGTKEKHICNDKKSYKKFTKKNQSNYKESVETVANLNTLKNNIELSETNGILPL